ncbi:MAG: hypothetical protein IPO40_24830 [Fibrobacteres bacterium]|nr:hypothetical protein [Fibrobacterota bacterium]
MMSTEISKITDQVAMLQSVVLKLIEAPLARRKHTLDELLSMRDMIKEGKITKVKKITEPAPGSDAEHPPVGYVLVPHASGEVIEADWIVWSFDRGPWKPLRPDSVGDRAHGGFHPMARPIPANEGDSRLAESVAIPVGWKECCFFDHANARTFGRTFIAPDPSIPWGEGYEAILPSEARNGGSCEFWADDTRKRWIPAERVQTWDERCRNQYAWRRRIPATTPTEPARDLSAEVGRLEEWQEAGLTASMMWDVIQAMRKTLDCDGTTTPVERAERVMRTINELRDTVERMEAENAKLRKDRDQYRKELEELEAKIDGIKELVG